MKKKLNKKSLKIFLEYTILFFIISLIAFLGFILRGKSLLLFKDAFNQHFIIFKNYHDIIRNGFSLFSWNIGLGEGIIGQYAYYIMGDPFFYLSIPFPTEMLKYIYSILIILRIYCCGLTFMLFCKYKKKDNFSTLIGSLVYAFSSYILVFSYIHPFFANATILLPLLFIGIEKFLKENNSLYIIIIYCISIISNFYFCYMHVILGIIYALIIYLCDIDNKSIKDFLGKLMKAGICFGISVLLSSFILLPIIYAFINSGRDAVELVTHYDINYYKTLFSNLLMLPIDNNFSTIGASSIVLLMFPVVIRNHKQHKSIIIFTLFLLICLLTPSFGKLMNGLSYSSNRWTFVICFCFAFLTTCGLNKDLKYSYKELMGMILCVVLSYAIIIILKNNNTLLIFKSLTSTTMILTVIASYNIYFIKKNIFKPIAKGMVILLLVLNLGYFGYQIYKPYIKNSIAFDNIENSYNSFNSELKNYNKAIDLIKKDTSFYRIGRFPRWHQNSAQYFDYKSPNYYLSISNKYLKNLSDDLKNFDVEVSKPLLEFDNRTRITTLMSEKYFITNKKNIERVPYNYSKYASAGELEIYKNESFTLPIVFYNKILLYDNWLKEDPLNREYLITKAAVLNSEDFDNVNLNEYNDYQSVVQKVNYQLDSEYQQQIDNKKIIINDTPCTIKFKIEDATNKELYLVLKNYNYKPFNGNNLSNKISINVNGVNNQYSIQDKNSSRYYYPINDLYINLGSFSKDKEVEYVFNKKGIYTFDEFEIYAVDMKSYEEDMDELDKNVKIIKVSKDGIISEVNNNEDGILQLSTGYSKGIKFYVDGKKVDSFIVNSGFVGIKLQSGKHIVEFTYETPYLKLGTFISVTTLVMIVICSIRKTLYIRKKASD